MTAWYSNGQKMLESTTQDYKPTTIVVWKPNGEKGHVITSFLYPTADFDFNDFYDHPTKKGFVIYPGKVTKADCFRIDHIGHLFPEDTEELLGAIREVAKDMNLLGEAA